MVAPWLLNPCGSNPAHIEELGGIPKLLLKFLSLIIPQLVPGLEFVWVVDETDPGNLTAIEILLVIPFI